MSSTDDREAYYDKLADTIEAGSYDVAPDTAEVREDYRVGRPHKSEPVAGTRPLAVRLTAADRQRLANYADRTGQPMSTVIRTAIEEYLGRHPAA